MELEEEQEKYYSLQNGMYTDRTNQYFSLGVEARTIIGKRIPHSGHHPRLSGPCPKTDNLGRNVRHITQIGL